MIKATQTDTTMTITSYLPAGIETSPRDRMVPETSAEERLLRVLLVAELPAEMPVLRLDDTEASFTLSVGDHQGEGWYALSMDEITDDPFMMLRGTQVIGRICVADTGDTMTGPGRTEVWWECPEQAGTLGRQANYLPYLPVLTLNPA